MVSQRSEYRKKVFIEDPSRDPGVPRRVRVRSFNRFHNYVVGELADINEWGRFSKPVLDVIAKKIRATMRPPASEEDIKKEIQKQFDAAVVKRDNDLFQTGRLYISFPVSLIVELLVACTSTSSCLIMFVQSSD